MNSNLLKYLILTFFALLISCQKDNETVFELIIGKWEWVKTIIPYGRQVSNPQTSGFSKTLEFMKDGKMNEYRNDSLITTSGYKIETDSSTPNYYVLTNSTIIGSHFYIVDDSLIFNEAYVDGPVSSYIRKN
jgi:UDP-N-acetylglucosamine transferase subunit ALG13